MNVGARRERSVIGVTDQPTFVGTTIAGLDPTGTVGLLVDTAVFASAGLHPSAVLTVATAQDTTEFAGVEPVAASLVGEQLRRVLNDLAPVAIKTGMLWSDEIGSVVAGLLESVATPLVVDPVMVDRTGTRIVGAGLIDVYRDRLIPRAAVVTPNRAEAALLAEIDVNSVDDAATAATRLLELGTDMAVVTGGGDADVSEPLVDVVATADGVLRIERRRHGSTNVRGTGDVLSAALAAGLALGDDLVTALARAHLAVDRAMERGAAAPVGRGRPSVRPA